MKFVILTLALIGAASAGFIAPAVAPVVSTYTAPAPIVRASSPLTYTAGGPTGYTAPVVTTYSAGGPFVSAYSAPYVAAPAVVPSAYGAPAVVPAAYSAPFVSAYSAVAPGVVTVEAWKKRA